MRPVNLLQPKRIAFGPGVAAQCAEDLISSGVRRVFVVTSPPLVGLVEPLATALRRGGVGLTVYPEIATEPTIDTFHDALRAARAASPEAVVGVGGGSALDVAKLVAALHDGDQDVRRTFGINLLGPRRTPLYCLPTTAGTGSEVSPNAILLDPEDELKKGVVSPHLVPDAAYVDPELTLTMPRAVTASTGLDALTHCIEAYANRYAHPIVDLYTLEGIRLVGAHLRRAVAHGEDLEARTRMSLASLYGGLCLGPVNTGAVHALAYPLGGEFHIAHGVSNAVLLPAVMAFNLDAAPERYAQVAVALGAEPAATPLETARRGVERVRALARETGIPAGLGALGIPEDAIPRMARAAMQVTRLLRNNLRDVGVADAEGIYRAAW